MIARRTRQREAERIAREVADALIADIPNILARSIAEALGMSGNEAAIAVIRKWMIEAGANAERSEL